VAFREGDAIGLLGINGQAFEYLDDVDTYTTAHAGMVSADVIMDPNGAV
jgi:hypothetical protein